MILNDPTGSISNSEEFKNRKRNGEDCGHKWVSIPKFCVEWVRPGWRKLNQEYQQQLCSCKKRHGPIAYVIRLYPTALDVMQSIFLVLVVIMKVAMNSLSKL